MDINTTKKLNNGVEIPYLGLGTLHGKDDEETVNAVRWAIEAGYRHIDTAGAYGNEKSVGQGIHQSGIDRKKIFVTTKLRTEHMFPGQQIKGFENSLKLLQMDYVDLYLIHWPIAGKTLAAWKDLEEIYKSGRARAIGVCNFAEHHFVELFRDAKVKPAINQIELHPHLSMQPLVTYCEKQGIAVEAWSPLGGLKGTGGKSLDDSTLKKIAEKHGKSVAQVILRWDLQKGIIAIPKSTHKERIISNANLYDFELSAAEMKTINDLDKDPQCFGRDLNNIGF
jgi:diketogulonate reductase-like aldo/keto reductase